MSLCIAVNNPSNYVIIAGDGRLTNGSNVVSDTFPMLTRLTQHISIFSSGAQDYCEMLRSRIGQAVNEHTGIHDIAKLVQEESRKIHEQFVKNRPTFYEMNKEGAALATVVAFFDVGKSECGFIEYCHTDDFIHHIVKGSKMTARGLERE